MEEWLLAECKSLNEKSNQIIPRKVYLWHKANLQLIKDDFCSNSLSPYSVNTPIQDPWYIFKSFCQDCLDLVSHKLYSSSTKQPWINTHIKHLINKRH